MSKTIPITNNGTSVKHVGTVMLQPGQTRIFNAHDLPPGYPGYEPRRKKIAQAQPKAEPAPAKQREPDALDALLAKSVKDIKPVLLDQSDHDLQELLMREGAKETPRTTLLEAIANEQLERSQMTTFRREIEELDDTSLANMLAEYPEGHPQHAIIEQVLEARTQPKTDNPDENPE